MLLPFSYCLTSEEGDVQSCDPVTIVNTPFWCLLAIFCPLFLWIKKKNMVPM